MNAVRTMDPLSLIILVYFRPSILVFLVSFLIIVGLWYEGERKIICNQRRLLEF